MKWKPEVSQEQMQKDAGKLTDWLKLRLKDDKIQLKEVVGVKEQG